MIIKHIKATLVVVSMTVMFTSGTAYAGGGAGGGPDAASGGSVLLKKKSSKKKTHTRKKRISHYEAVADEFARHARDDELSFYFSRKSRLRRFLKRVDTEFDKQPDYKKRHLWPKLKEIQFTKDKRYSRKAKSRVVALIRYFFDKSALEEGEITKEEFNRRTKSGIGFVP